MTYLTSFRRKRRIPISQVLFLVTFLLSLTSSNASDTVSSSSPSSSSLRGAGDQQQIAPRIVGGNDASRNEYPFMVTLLNRDRQLVCGGTLMSPTVVLTGAHCASDLLVYAWIGRTDFSDSTEPFDEIPIHHEIIHPQYDLESWEHDAMILQLERPVSPQFRNDNNFVALRTTPLMDDIANTLDTTRLTTLGWGVIEPGTDGTIISDVLQEAPDLEYIPLEDCRNIKKGGTSYDYLTDDMMCTFADGQDHCFGDSGGPVLWKDENDGGTLYQVGIIAFGIACADKDFPGVSIRSEFIADFVRDYACAWDGNDAPDHWNCDTLAMALPPTSSPVTPPSGPTWIIVEIFLDIFPTDISWNVKELDTNRMIADVQEGEYVEGEYVHWDDDVRHYLEVVPGHSYQFTIEDSFGDGLIMSGYYQILWMDETLVLGVGAFGADRSHVFVIPDVTDAPSSSPTMEEEDQCLGIAMACGDDVNMMMGNNNMPCCSNRCMFGRCQRASGSTTTRAKVAKGRGGAAGRVRGE